MEQLTLWEDPLIAGLDVRSNGSIRLAFVEPEAVGYPNTVDLHRCVSLRAFERYWDCCFAKEKSDRHLIVGMDCSDKSGLMLWFAERHVTILDLRGHDLRPFIHESANYETPPRYRRAHALAQCAATKLTMPSQLASLYQTLNDLNFHLREVERGLNRVAAASPIA